MADSGMNPCDLCKRYRVDCEDCALDRLAATKFKCAEDKCFINDEGSCLLGLYERCGAWKEGRKCRS